MGERGGGQQNRRGKGCDIFHRKEKKAQWWARKGSDSDESKDQLSFTLTPSASFDSPTSFCRWENRPRKITWFVQNHRATKYRNAFCKNNSLLTLVGKFKNQTCPNTSLSLPYPEITKHCKLEVFRTDNQPINSNNSPYLGLFLGAATVQARARGRVPKSGPWVQGVSPHSVLAVIQAIWKGVLRATWQPNVTGRSWLGWGIPERRPVLLQWGKTQGLCLGDGSCACITEPWTWPAQHLPSLQTPLWRKHGPLSLKSLAY